MAKTDKQELTIHVKAEARRLGFELVGVTGPEPLPHVDVFQRWLAAGRHAGMAYLASNRARQRRNDLRLILPECQSVLVVATNYLPKITPPPSDPIEGRIAAYAMGEDYHEVLLERLKTLVAAIEAHLGQPIPHRIYTDTGPILERELAQRAGLGWIGKNTCLINPERGSYLLLAEVLLGIQLPPDQPFENDRCGECTRCIETCPTACILPDRTLDARKCISYLTIEEKGPIPSHLRPSIGSWVFGCDICQQVCPWNIRFAAPTADPAFQPRPFIKQLDLQRFLTLTPDSWSEPLKGSPLLRPKRRGLLRNAAVVAGNSANPAYISSLAELLRVDQEILVRVHAAWALGRIGGSQAVNALVRAREKETNAEVLREIEAAIDTATSAA
jgi:epoxyqueuosine reductase